MKIETMHKIAIGLMFIILCMAVFFILSNNTNTTLCKTNGYQKAVILDDRYYCANQSYFREIENVTGSIIWIGDARYIGRG